MKKRIISLFAIAMSVSVTFASDFTVEEGEMWWGGATGLASRMPFGSDTLSLDHRIQNFNNQTSPLLVSNHGRYLWSDGPMKLQFDGNGKLLADDGCKMGNGATPTLRGAYLEAMKNHFSPSGRIPASEFFSSPIYCTWIELMYDQNQADILKYAHDLVDHGYPAGVLMIDDNWQQDYGVWEFRPDRFPNPKAMVDELHELGFKVMLWVAPFVSPDCQEYRSLASKGYLVKDAADPSQPGILRWWNGISAAYDLSNPAAYAYVKDTLKRMCEKYGIDGFKMDGGDPERYTSRTISSDAYDVEQTQAWARLAAEFPFSELRACWKEGAQPLVQRLGDKPYGWEGVKALVPGMIAAGLLGHAYACPDMIGGGEYMSFLNLGDSPLDPGVIVRSCQIHAMMPMMQFSVAPWRVLDAKSADICLTWAKRHAELSPYIIEQAQKSAVSGEPIVRAMAYEFPGEGLDDVMDQYMLGDKYLVAPVTEPGDCVTRTVRLPKGKWREDTGRVFKGGRTITTDVPLERIPVYERI